MPLAFNWYIWYIRCVTSAVAAFWRQHNALYYSNEKPRDRARDGRAIEFKSAILIVCGTHKEICDYVKLCTWLVWKIDLQMLYLHHEHFVGMARSHSRVALTSVFIQCFHIILKTAQNVLLETADKPMIIIWWTIIHFVLFFCFQIIQLQWCW